MLFRSSITLIAVAFALGVAAPARALVHLWDIAEIYSNADGSVQFVEFFTTGESEIGWSGAALRSVSNDVLVEFDLNVDAPTNDRRVLVATPGFADLPGAVAPDFEIPLAFIDVGGDTLVFTGSVDQVTFEPDQLPTDGLHSLYRTLTIPSPPTPTPAGPDDLFVGENSPTNYAGEVGHLLPEPGATALAASALSALAVLGSTRRRDRRRGSDAARG
jgi:hypothetical protein